MDASPDADTLTIPEILAALRQTFGNRTPAYDRVWLVVAEGRVPAQKVRGRWRIQRCDLPRLATALGLTRPAPRRFGAR
jgi:hypothetical protein